MRRDAHGALVRALLHRAGNGCRIVTAAERSWASVTFEGARHVIELAFPAARADTFVCGIEEAEFDLGRHLLADLAIVDRRTAMDGSEQLRLEALTLREGGPVQAT